MPNGSPKYPLTELGYVATVYTKRHIMSFAELAEKVTEETGIEVKKTAFQQARRDDRAYELLRKTVMDYMREQDSELVEASLTAYDVQYRQDKRG